MMRARSLAVVALAACRAPIPPVPGQGGPPWTEVASPHFTVWSDAAPDEVRALVVRMERMRAVLSFAAFPSVPAEGRGLAIVLRDDAELRAFSATDQARPFAASVEAPLWQPVIVLSAASGKREVERALAHELTHAISLGVVHHQPRWFAEGMASYFQTAGLDPKREIIEIGGSPTGERIDVTHILSADELFGWREMKRHEAAEYVTAWAVFFFLVNQHGDELQRFAKLLDEAGPQVERDPAVVKRVWDQAFTSVPYAKLDGALHDWLFTGRSYKLTPLKVNLGQLPITDRPLRDAEVYALRALLRQVAGKDPRAELAAALASEPTNVIARVLGLALDRKRPSVDEARAITRAHPDDWRAWLMLLDTLGPNEPEAREARATACKLVGANPALSPPAELCERKLVGHSADNTE